MSEEAKGRAMRAALFVIGFLPLLANVAASFTSREHVFSEWLVAGGFIVSVIVANRSDDMIAVSASKLGKAAARWLPWYKGGTTEHQQPPGTP